MTTARESPDMEAITEVFRQLRLTGEKEREHFRHLSALGNLKDLKKERPEQQKIRNHTGEGGKDSDAQLE